MYEGRTSAEQGTILGHENMGSSRRSGPASPGSSAATGCRSRPFADFNLLPLPPGADKELDFATLSDSIPTGYHGVALAGVTPGDTVAVYGVPGVRR